MHGKNIAKTFWAHFFEYPYRWNGSKTNLDVALIISNGASKDFLKLKTELSKVLSFKLSMK